MITNRRNKECITFYLSYSYLMVQEPLDEACLSSLFSYTSIRFMTSSGISVMSLPARSLVRKCSETVVGLEILDGLSTGLRFHL